MLTMKFFILFLLGSSTIGLVALYLIFLNEKLISFVRTRTPTIIQNHMRRRNVKKMEPQIVDSVDMLGNGLKAGLSLQQTFAMVSKEAPHPMRDEFELIIDQIKMGRNFEDALIEWKERVPLPDINILVESILVLRQTGGNLVETFESIAETIRERQKVSGKIKVLTAQGVTQAVVIILLPFVLGVGLYFVAGWYIMPLVTTWLGWLMIFFAICLQALGALWMKKIVTIRV